MGEIYLDACIFIYAIEGAPGWRAAIEARSRTHVAPRFVTSQLSRLECRTKPLRDGNDALLLRYDAAFAPDSVRLVDVSSAVIDRATVLRARHGFKVPDAMHLATAIELGVDELWTGDAGLARCTDVTVVLLTPVSP